MSIDQGSRNEPISPTKPGEGGARREPRVVAPYAVDPASSRGRLVPEGAYDTRSPYARDRDRILHSAAFRRLNYKTQVFIYHEGDHYRSRLTHTLEVAQIARALARRLQVDEDLTEALALAHDLGHPPFGHAGERALDAAMAHAGGFDHNAQSLRVVTELEKKYARFDGLNLTWEALEGLVKHNGPLQGAKAAKPERAVPESILAYCARQDLELGTYPSLEAQIASLADDIAYNNHDIDDGYRAGLFTFAELAQVPIAERALADVGNAYPGIDGSRLLYESIRRLISAMVEDAVAETERRLAKLAPRSADAVRHAPGSVGVFSETMRHDLDRLRAFLFARVYRHPRIAGIMGDAENVVRDLFKRYSEAPDALPPEWRVSAPREARAYARHISDFIAGMTDRYALAEHRRLFDATPDLR